MSIHARFSDNDRVAPRLQLSLPGTLLATGGNHKCIVTNLSRTGVLIALEEPLRVGEQAYLRSGPIDHFMQVTRRETGLNALEFDIPVTDTFVFALRKFQESFEELDREALQEQARTWTSGENTGRW